MKDYATLTVKKTPPRPARIVIIGEEGVGKTTAGLAFPSPYYLTAEDGLVGKPFESVHRYTPTDWPDALEHATWFATTKHGYGAYIIDTADWLEPLIIAFVLARDAKKDLSEYRFGAGYAAITDEMRKFLATLERVNRDQQCFILINTHAIVKTYNNPEGDDYDRHSMELTKRVSSLLRQWSDVVLFAKFNTTVLKKGARMKAAGGVSRIVETSHAAAWDAKNRYSLPGTMDFDMPSILATIKNEGTEQHERIATKLDEVIGKLPKKEKEAAKKFVDEHQGDLVQLAQLLQRIEEKLGESETDETKNPV